MSDTDVWLTFYLALAWVTLIIEAVYVGHLRRRVAELEGRRNVRKGADG